MGHGPTRFEDRGEPAASPHCKKVGTSVGDNDSDDDNRRTVRCNLKEGDAGALGESRDQTTQ